jgi:hypothetical protein
MGVMENEQIKLTANLFNSVASGIVITGAVAPLVAGYFGMVGPGQASALALLIGEIVWLAIAGALHLAGRRLLRSLTP